MADFSAEAEGGQVAIFLSGNVQGACEVWLRICRLITRRAARRRALAHLDDALAHRRRVTSTGSIEFPERNSPRDDEQLVIADLGDRPAQVPQYPSIRNARLLSMTVREEIS